LFKWKKPALLLSVAIFALFSSAVIFAYDDRTKEILQAAFEQISMDTETSQQLVAVNGEPNIAELGDIKITQERFIFYKANLDLMREINKDAKIPEYTDEELIENLVKKDLMVNYAKSIGITIDSYEIDQVIEYEKSMLDNLTDNEMIKVLMENRIKITGMTEEEFWRSDIPRNEYEKAFYTNKLMARLLENKVIEDISGLANFENELLAENRSLLKINP